MVDVYREEYQQLYDAAAASVDSAALARTRHDRLTAELTGHREKLGNLETFEEDAKSSKLNLLVRSEVIFNEKRGGEAGRGAKGTKHAFSSAVASCSPLICWPRGRITR